MPDADGHRRLEWMHRAEAWRLLESGVIGRLAVVGARGPEIFPVNYALDGAAIVMRTDAGTKLDAGARREPACFEIDAFDTERRTGWSVVVHGSLEELTATRPHTHARVGALAIAPWADASKAHLLRLVPTTVTGRRVTAPPDDARPMRRPSATAAAQTSTVDVGEAGAQ